MRLNRLGEGIGAGGLVCGGRVCMEDLVVYIASFYSIKLS